MLIKFETDEAAPCKWFWEDKHLIPIPTIRWGDYPTCKLWPNPEQTVAWLKQYLEEYEDHNTKG